MPALSLVPAPSFNVTHAVAPNPTSTAAPAVTNPPTTDHIAPDHALASAPAGPGFWRQNKSRLLCTCAHGLLVSDY